MQLVFTTIDSSAHAHLPRDKFTVRTKVDTSITKTDMPCLLSITISQIGYAEGLIWDHQDVISSNRHVCALQRCGAQSWLAELPIIYTYRGDHAYTIIQSYVIAVLCWSTYTKQHCKWVSRAQHMYVQLAAQSCDRHRPCTYTHPETRSKYV